MSETGDGRYKNPAADYNALAKIAKGDVLFLTNPENLHLGPVLNTVREHIRPHRYIVAGCRPLGEMPESFQDACRRYEDLLDRSFCEGWYQHSRLCPRLLHFAAGILRRDFLELGGFDEEYMSGLAWEDNDFVQKVMAAKFHIGVSDHPFVLHQPHPRPPRTAETERLEARNQALFHRKWPEVSTQVESLR